MQKQRGTIGFFPLLGLLLIGLKLGGVITWPWVWVLLPLWGTAVVALVVVVLAVVLDGLWEKKDPVGHARFHAKRKLRRALEL